MNDARRYAPATLRNREAILAVLARALPPRGLVLEVASGSGEHVVHFAAAVPALEFQPSEPDPASRASIDAWAVAASLPNLRPALALDAEAEIWQLAAADAVLCINMIHIAPWRACCGLIRGAARVLGAGGVLYLYGPYKRAGRHTAPSNAEFDLGLRARNPEWGVRDLEAVAQLPNAAGFSAPAGRAMPAHHFSVVFLRLSPKQDTHA